MITASEARLSATDSTHALAGLQRALAELAPISEHEWRRLADGIEVVAYPRRSFLLKRGEPVDWLGFLGSGLVRYFHRERGREVTLGFDCEQRFVGDYAAFVARAPARVAVEALEDSVLVRLPREAYDALAAHTSWRELFRRLVERQLLQRIDKELRIRTRTPRERYEELVRTGSYLVKRVPQYHVASFLGIAPETLSRIRARS